MIEEVTAPSRELLRLEAVNKWFHRHTKREQHVLRNISLTISRGQVVVIIGPSGSGKSTLLRCINFIAPPDSGSITFDGRQWLGQTTGTLNPLVNWRRQRDLVHLRTQIGMVFQHFNLFPHMTALMNVTLGPMRALHLPRQVSEQRAMEQLDRVGLGGKAQSYPAQLSGGEKQRVAIARALAMQPQLMLFDEVTSALDPELVAGILDEIKKLARAGMTMVIVTHEMRFAEEVGDRIVFMDAGQVVEEGPAKVLIKDPQNHRTRAFLRAIL